VKVYKRRRWAGGDSFDALWSDLRSGGVKPGEQVKVWCEKIGGYVLGRVEWYGGQPSLKEREDAQVDAH